MVRLRSPQVVGTYFAIIAFYVGEKVSKDWCGGNDTSKGKGTFRKKK